MGKIIGIKNFNYSSLCMGGDSGSGELDVFSGSGEVFVMELFSIIDLLSEGKSASSLISLQHLNTAISYLDDRLMLALDDEYGGRNYPGEIFDDDFLLDEFGWVATAIVKEIVCNKCQKKEDKQPGSIASLYGEGCSHDATLNIAEGIELERHQVYGIFALFEVDRAIAAISEKEIYKAVERTLLLKDFIEKGNRILYGNNANTIKEFQRRNALKGAERYKPLISIVKQYHEKSLKSGPAYPSGYKLADAAFKDVMKENKRLRIIKEEGGELDQVRKWAAKIRRGDL